MLFESYSIQTNKRNELIDISSYVKDFVKKKKIENACLKIWIPHTTAAVTVNENFDHSVKSDFSFSLSKISPIYKEFEHSEGNSDAHIKSSLIGCSQDILIKDSKVILGTWQGIFFCEFDGPRKRNFYLFIP